MRISDWSSDVCSSDLLAGVLHVKIVEALAHAQNFTRLDLDIRCHALRPARGLVDHDPCIGKRDTHARLAGGPQEAAHRNGLTELGRGSGRESRSTDVKIQVGAGTIKKKTIIHK